MSSSHENKGDKSNVNTHNHTGTEQDEIRCLKTKIKLGNEKSCSRENDKRSLFATTEAQKTKNNCGEKEKKSTTEDTDLNKTGIEKTNFSSSHRNPGITIKIEKDAMNYDKNELNKKPLIDKGVKLKKSERCSEEKDKIETKVKFEKVEPNIMRDTKVCLNSCNNESVKMLSDQAEINTSGVEETTRTENSFLKQMEKHLAVKRSDKTSKELSIYDKVLNLLDAAATSRKNNQAVKTVNERVEVLGSSFNESLQANDQHCTITTTMESSSVGGKSPGLKNQATSPKLDENIQPATLTKMVHDSLVQGNTERLVDHVPPKILITPDKMKTWVPPSDTDPMSQTFLRMPFTYQSLQVQTSPDNSKPHVKRPMNSFMIWAKKNRAQIAKRFPKASNAEISVRLGHIWNQLPNEQQKPYFDEANSLKEKHKHENPNWVYQPRPGKKAKRCLFATPGSQSVPSSPAPRSTIKLRHRPIQPKSAPCSPIAKRCLWPKGKPLTDEQMQSNIVEELLNHEQETGNDKTGNPTVDEYLDEWLSPKRHKISENECLVKDAMLPAINDDLDHEMLEADETDCDKKDFEKYLKELKSVDKNYFTRLENSISSLEEEDDIKLERLSIIAKR